MSEKTIGKISLKPKSLDTRLNNEELFKREYDTIWDTDCDEDDEDWEDEEYNLD